MSNVLVRFFELLLEFVEGGREETLSALVVQRGDWPVTQRDTASALANATRRFLAASAPPSAAREVREAIRALLAERRVEPAGDIASALMRVIELRRHTTEKEIRAWNAARTELLNAAARAVVA
jgi:hypothetical protein